MGRMADFTPGQATVDPALGSTNPPSTDPSAQVQPPASAPAGPEPAPAGPPGEATSNSATAPAPATTLAATAPPAAPPAPPPAQTPAEPGPTPVPETVDPPATPPAPAQPLSVEDVERARQTAVEETEAKWRTRQSGQDRQINDMGRRVEAAEAATEAQKQLTRDSMLAREGLTEEEKTRLQTQWAQDDREQKLNSYSESVLDLHSDVEIAQLLIEYRDIPGVNAEALEGITQEERDGFCKDQKIAFLEGGGRPAAATNGAAQPAPAAPATPPPEAPAGASAPSDVGAAGAPPAPMKKNENPGADAMAENINQSGWREVTFSSRQGRR